ncbi:winged helix-turn-helix domain-containing protein [Bradyrhizobium sp. LB14.3]|uniref:winged helix-turn-helix domain-containing protein n=1 Tax=Bradyrhizobium sp. LB14.3 TaxID=3156328 RepID=UPI003398A514
MESLTFLGLAERILEEEQRPLSPHEIWTIAVSKGYDRELRSRTGKTPFATLYSAIMTDVQGKRSRFVRVTEGPARYFLKRLVEVGGTAKSPEP